MRIVDIETFHSKVCNRTSCDKCGHADYDPWDGFSCPTLCMGAIDGFLREDYLDGRDKQLLGWTKPRRDGRRRLSTIGKPIRGKTMKVIAMVNQKGGVAKTTTALMLAAGLARDRKRVLVLDLDAQGNLTASIPAECRAGFTAAEVLAGSAEVSSLKGKALSVIPSALSLSSADLTLTQTGKEYRLKEALSPIGSAFDYCVIDTPPTLGILTVNALTAADGIIIPAQADIFSLQGINQLGDTVSTVRRYCNSSLKVYGILLTRWNGRAIISKEVSDLLAKAAEGLGTRLLNTRIRECTAVKEAVAAKQSIYSYAPRSNAAEDYGSFVKEIKETIK